jgi:hypothetical protein
VNRGLLPTIIERFIILKKGPKVRSRSGMEQHPIILSNSEPLA